MMMKFLPGEATVNNKGVKTVCRPGLDPPGELTALPRPPIAGATAPPQEPHPALGAGSRAGVRSFASVEKNPGYTALG